MLAWVSLCVNSLPFAHPMPRDIGKVQTSHITITWAFHLLNKSDRSHSCWVASVFGHMETGSTALTEIVAHTGRLAEEGTYHRGQALFSTLFTLSHWVFPVTPGSGYSSVPVLYVGN